MIVRTLPAVKQTSLCRYRLAPVESVKILQEPIMAYASARIEFRAVKLGRPLKKLIGMVHG